ncbi:MAG: radical SAM family heme chaperone HemW [Muribaculaceae bacterium]
MAGLYVHIPFCRSKCAYCDFYSTPRMERMEEYVDALIAEYALRRDEVGESFTTLYIGGGTPSALPSPLLGRLLDALIRPGMEEITIEANPDDMTRTYARDISSMGVNRVSMGFQSMIDAELQSVGRRHTSRQSIEAVAALRDCGIGNISGDLIYGLPTQTPESWRQSVEAVMSMELPHLSAYSLSYEPGTRLSAMLTAGKIQELDDETCGEMYGILCKAAKSHGYEHYEISNLSRPGYRSRHNSSYWDYTPYLGLGCAAHSFDGSVRRYNPSNLKAYLDSITKRKSCYISEQETDTDRYNDYIITALRTSDGIDLGKMSRWFDPAQLMAAAKPFLERGTLRREDDRIYFPEEAWLISDGVLRELII